MKSIVRLFVILTLILITGVSCQKEEVETLETTKPVTKKPQKDGLIDHNSTVKVAYSLADLKIDFTRTAEVLNLSKLIKDDIEIVFDKSMDKT